MAFPPESTCSRSHLRGQNPSWADGALKHKLTRSRWPRVMPNLSLISMTIGCLFLSFANAGCATVHGEKYTYNNLPKNLIAGVRENPQTIELSKLASATTDSDVLDHGDVVEVSISAGLNEKDTIRIPVRIQDSGDVELPEIGRVHVAGLKVTAAEATIVQECIARGLYRSPSVTLLMKQQRTNRIMVAGAVKKPSVYELPRGQSDLLSALSKAEGLDPTAGTQVIIRNMGNRAGTRPDAIASGTKNGIDTIGHSVEMTSKLHETNDTIKVDLVSATKNGTGGYQLEDGAVVYVEKRDPEPLHVIGLVTRPGRFEFPIAEELRVTDAIALAGGVSSMAADKIFIIRRKPSALINKTIDPENPDNVETILIQVSLANAKQKATSNIRLAPGDVVSVEQTPMTVILELFKRTSMNFGGSIPLMGSPLF